MANPSPQQLSSVQVLRVKYNGAGGWLEEWVDLSDDISLNRSDSDEIIYITPGGSAPTPGLVSNITDSRIDESSGLAYTPYLDYALTFNDEGESPQIFIIRVSDGSTQGTITSLSGGGSISDPEAIQVGPDGRIWFADIGDNNRSRSSVAIIGTDGACPPNGFNGAMSSTRFTVTYPGGAKYNAECLLVHPITGQMYIVTKESSGKLFKFPEALTSSMVPVNQNVALPTNVSDGCFTVDGKYVLFRCENRSETLVYNAETWDYVTAIASPSVSKGESITCEPGGMSFLMGSEGANSPLYRVLLPEDFWPETEVLTTPNYALRLRAKIADEETGWCRRIVPWTLQEGSTEWVRYGESNWQTEGRWWCSAGESGYEEFFISMPIGTKFDVWVAAENQEILTDSNGNQYRAYGASTEGSVWSNRYPAAEQKTATGLTITEAGTLDLKWGIVDEDTDTAESFYGIQIRRAGYGDVPPSDLLELDTGAQESFMEPGDTGTWQITGGDYAPNMWHEWRVAVKDYDLWSPWSSWRTFFVIGDEETPVPLTPSGDVSLDISLPSTFTWEFRDNVQPSSQQLASLRYRPVDSEDDTPDDSWVLLSGTVTTPGSSTSWVLPAFTFLPGVHYEWQVQTQSSSVSGLSDWSTSATFWTAPPVSTISPGPPNTMSVNQGTLGCGTYRVFVYERGGQKYRGEITPIRQLQYDRRRDDISQAALTTNGFGDDCAALLKTLHAWIHEIVIYRDGVRVWEGPITRITEEDDGVSIAAHDPMVYVYRRILRNGYNDAYPNLQTVVFRATRIIQDALAYDDPNILGYLTPISHTGDARESRVVAGWSKTAWEEVDDMAATAGLDYTTVGRRIILWDVHREIGRLPEMRNGDFSDPVIVTEYGMLTANVFAVTNNAGVYSYAQTFLTDPGPYGHVEMVASAYGETEGTVTEALTPEALQDLQNVLKEQATRNISGRYPTPVIVRVPDNTTLSPELEIGINQLVPGVRIPLRSVGRLREITQLQRLDKVTVTYNADEQEKIKVVLSPAPSANVESEPEAPPE